MLTNMVQRKLWQQILRLVCGRIQSTKVGKLWQMDRMTFQVLMAEAANSSSVEIENFLASVPLLQTLTKQQRAKIAGAVSPCSFSDGDEIITQGDRGDIFYLIRSGEVRCVKKDGFFAQEKELVKLGKGAYFGERALLTNEARTHARTHTRTHAARTHARVHTHGYARARTHAGVCTGTVRTGTHGYARVRTGPHGYARMQGRARMQGYARVHTGTHVSRG